MTGHPPWRSIRWVMIAIIQVALLAWVIRSWGQTEFIVILLPMAAVSGITMSFARPNPKAVGLESLASEDRCPKCRQPELRPVVRPRAGMFAPASGYRCATCRTTFRQEEKELVEVPEYSPTTSSDASAITYLVDLLALEDEILFLDDPESPAESDALREHPDVCGVKEERNDEIAKVRGCDDGQQ